MAQTQNFNIGFGKQVRAIADKIGADIETVARKFIGEAFSRIILKSPVDTGRFRMNWNYSEGEPDESTVSYGGGDKALHAGEMKSRISVRANLDGKTIYLTNSLPYAAVLEYGLYPNPPKLGSKKRGEDGYAIHTINGYSMQAPHGMVRVTVAEIGSILQEAMKK